MTNREMATKNLTRSETEDGTWEKLTTTTATQNREHVAGSTAHKMQEI
jgi:hypothetical protein